ncbi:hypothetical protein Tco_0824604, partial [Tanacetum coccineum]
MVMEYAPVKLKLCSTFMNSSSPTPIVAARVVTSEATRGGTTRDDGEIGKDLDDHSGDGE